jgi:hypothetical protein
MDLATYLGDLRFLEADLILAGIYQDERPPKGLAGQLDWFIYGHLSDLLISGRFRGAPGECALIATQRKIGTPRYMVVGLGNRGDMNAAALGKLWPEVLGRVKCMKAGIAAVELLGGGGTLFRPPQLARLLMSHLEDAGCREVVSRRLFILPADEDEQEEVEKILRHGAAGR